VFAELAGLCPHWLLSCLEKQATMLLLLLLLVLMMMMMMMMTIYVNDVI